MSKIKYKHLPMTRDIYELNIHDIQNNLIAYGYHSKYLKKLNSVKFDKEDVHYISTYSSFVGEVYENVIYELLLKYAISQPLIDKFVLKGPHQDGYTNEKNGLLIDRNNQIVYKSGYKDVSEFDGMFFIGNELWFVESTIVKTTVSLKKRLKKKSALLKLLFPKMTIRALIILTEGVIGANTFPSYCTVWITKQLQDTTLIDKLIKQKKANHTEFVKAKDKKLIETKNIRFAVFKYFEKLSSLLIKLRASKDAVLDFDYLRDQELEQYFDIFSKLYMGYLTKEDFIRLYNDFELDDIVDNKIIVTIEKQKDRFVLIYYANTKPKNSRNKLKKIEILENGELKISDKDPKGFTASEVKYMEYIWKPYHRFKPEDIKKIDQNLTNLVKQIYILSDTSIDNAISLPMISIKYLDCNIDLTQYDGMIITSKNGILSLEHNKINWKDIPIYTISSKTANMVKKYKGNLQYIGKNGHANKFAIELIDLLKDKKVLLIRPKKVVSQLKDILEQNNIVCDELITYETNCNDKLTKNDKPPKHSIIIFSSPSTLNCFLDKFGWDETYMAISIGYTTAKYIPEYINYKVSKHTSLKSCVDMAQKL